jgi:hypothetical protein
MTNNRGIISTGSIADKLKKVENDLSNIEQKVMMEPSSNSNPLLFINGKLNRKKYQYVAKNFSLSSKLENEIKAICKGVDLTIFNYLIALGLESIKKNKELTSVEWSEFEEKINQ